MIRILCTASACEREEDFGWCCIIVVVLYYCDCDCGYDPVLVLDLFLYIIWLRL